VDGFTNSDPFNDSAWRRGATGVGFSAGLSLVAPTSLAVRFSFEAAPVGNVVADTKPSGAVHNGVNVGATWLASSTDVSPAPVTRAGCDAIRRQRWPPDHPGPPRRLQCPPRHDLLLGRTPGATGPGQYGAALFDRRANTYTGPGDVIVMQDDGRVFVQAGNGTTGGINSFATPQAINDNRWHHLAYVYDQSATGFIAVYLDGALARQQANTSAWSWSPTQEIELGCSYDAFWRRLNGWMDDFRIYSHILTTNELAQLVQGDGGIAAELIGTDLADEMLRTNASAFLRIPFVVSEPTNFAFLTLQLRYDDGFVAWINGEEVARAQAPDGVAWNSAATALHGAGAAESIVIGNEPACSIPARTSSPSRASTSPAMTQRSWCCRDSPPRWSCGKPPPASISPGPPPARPTSAAAPLQGPPSGTWRTGLPGPPTPRICSWSQSWGDPGASGRRESALPRHVRRRGERSHAG